MHSVVRRVSEILPSSNNLEQRDWECISFLPLCQLEQFVTFYAPSRSERDQVCSTSTAHVYIHAQTKEHIIIQHVYIIKTTLRLNYM